MRTWNLIALGIYTLASCVMIPLGVWKSLLLKTPRGRLAGLVLDVLSGALAYTVLTLAWSAVR